MENRISGGGRGGGVVNQGRERTLNAPVINKIQNKVNKQTHNSKPVFSVTNKIQSNSQERIPKRPYSQEYTQTQSNKLYKQNPTEETKFNLSVTSSGSSESSDSESDFEMNQSLTDHQNPMLKQKNRRQHFSHLNESNTQHRLPTVKLRISRLVLEDFMNPFELANEINRCKKLEKTEMVIKFAYIIFTKAIVIIATDDQATYDLLCEDWPKDAFIKGASVLNHSKDTINETENNFKLVLRNIHLGINIEDPLVVDQLGQQGIFNAVRKISREGKSLPIVTAATRNLDDYKRILKNGITLGFTRIRSIESPSNLKQCHNCQGFGHKKFDCPKSITCAKCSGPHHFKECKNDLIQCANCSGQHWSFSRSCPHVKEQQEP